MAQTRPWRGNPAHAKHKLTFANFPIFRALTVLEIGDYRHAWNTADFRLRLLDQQSRAKRMDSRQQLVSNYVRSFVENDGGSLRFVPKRGDDGRMCWEVFGVYPEGAEQQVKLSGTGRPKVLKSADAVIAYWQSIYPGASEVTIPILPGGDQ